MTMDFFRKFKQLVNTYKFITDVINTIKYFTKYINYYSLQCCKVIITFFGAYLLNINIYCKFIEYLIDLIYIYISFYDVLWTIDFLTLKIYIVLEFS